MLVNWNLSICVILQFNEHVDKDAYSKTIHASQQEAKHGDKM